jgi:hypothetical protein
MFAAIVKKNTSVGALALNATIDKETVLNHLHVFKASDDIMFFEEDVILDPLGKLGTRTHTRLTEEECNLMLQGFYVFKRGNWQIIVGDVRHELFD